MLAVSASMFKIKNFIHFASTLYLCVLCDSYNVRLFFGTAFLIEISYVLCGVGTESLKRRTIVIHGH